MASSSRIENALSFRSLRVVSGKGLIGLKLQDLANIRASLDANWATLNRQEVRECFALFGREPLLEELLNDNR